MSVLSDWKVFKIEDFIVVVCFFDLLILIEREKKKGWWCISAVYNYYNVNVHTDWHVSWRFMIKALNFKLEKKNYGFSPCFMCFLYEVVLEMS